MRVFVRQIATAMTMVVLAGGFATLSAQQLPTVMAQGLDNPRGLAFGPDGMLYVVEAGRGGTSALCLPTPNGMGTRCYGASRAGSPPEPTVMKARPKPNAMSCGPVASAPLGTAREGRPVSTRWCTPGAVIRVTAALAP